MNLLRVMCLVFSDINIETERCLKQKAPFCNLYLLKRLINSSIGYFTGYFPGTTLIESDDRTYSDKPC